MEIYYNGTNITDSVHLESAIATDRSRGGYDTLEITFLDAEKWFRWQPVRDDIIEIVHNGYSTGGMYVISVMPEDGKYRIMACSVPYKARRERWSGYSDIYLYALMKACADECGMDYKAYGLDNTIQYGYLIRKHESCAAFLERVLRREGSVLKTWNGRFAAINIDKAQDLNAEQTIQIDADTQGVSYVRRDDIPWKSVTVVSPYATGIARDTGADDGEDIYMEDLPAEDNAQAVRWARSIIADHNRERECLAIDCEFNAGFTAMARVDINSHTDTAGEWIIDEVTHDFINETSHAQLRRCIRTVVTG